MNHRNGLSEKEAGYLGYLASREILKQKHQQIVDLYQRHPRLCELCQKPLPYEKRYNRFCSSSCSASFNNLERSKNAEFRYKSSLAHGGTGAKFRCRTCGKLLNVDQHVFCSNECKNAFTALIQTATENNIARKVTIGICPVCGNEIPANKNNKYCSLSCAAKAKWIATREHIEQTGSFPFNSRLNETDRRIVRKYLEEKYGHECMICGHKTWNDHEIPLIVDHIDGDATNHQIENFRLVCPNCDALLDTFKNRGNRKSSRVWRKDYYSN